MQPRVEKRHQPLSGVKCVVNTCHFYGSGDHCMSSAIEVQPRNAQSSEQTDCATFMPER